MESQDTSKWQAWRDEQINRGSTITVENGNKYGCTVRVDRQVGPAEWFCFPGHVAAILDSCPDRQTGCGAFCGRCDEGL